MTKKIWAILIWLTATDAMAQQRDFSGPEGENAEISDGLPARNPEIANQTFDTDLYHSDNIGTDESVSVKVIRSHTPAGQLRTASESTEREFLYYGDEKALRSRSIGNTSTGYMVHSKQLPAPSIEIRQLPVQYSRSLNYGTDEMIELLTFTASKMKKKYRNSVLFMGNIAARGGGPISYSVSHRTGRDADIIYYFKTKDKNYLPPTMVRYNRSLTADSEGHVLHFDVEKNAEMLMTMMSHPKIRVQFLFVQNHLQKAILAYLETSSHDAEAVDRLRQVMVQPKSVHDDHVHVRIYCSDDDICSGCVDRSVIHPWIRDPEVVKDKCVLKHYKKLKSGKSSNDKAAALQNIALMGAASENPTRIVEALKNEDPLVRRMAVRASSSLGRAKPALLSMIATEREGDILCEIVDAVELWNESQSSAKLLTLLDREDCGCGKKKLSSRVLSVLKYSESAEIARALPRYFGSDNEKNRAIDDALSMLTNHAHAAKPGEEAAHWKKWMDEHGSESRKAWLISGFKAAKYHTTAGLGKKDIAELIFATGDARHHISYNAQRVLMTLSGRKPESRSWQASDCKWYWARYFKKNQKKYKINLDMMDVKGNKI